MTRNHRNRSWRSQWRMTVSGKMAVHKSGTIAQLLHDGCDSHAELNVDGVSPEQRARWDMATLQRQAEKLLRESARDAPMPRARQALAGNSTS